MWSHILKALIHGAKSLQDIIATSTARKNVCKGIIKMLTYQSIGAYSSQHIVLGIENDVAHVD